MNGFKKGKKQVLKSDFNAHQMKFIQDFSKVLTNHLENRQVYNKEHGYDKCQKLTKILTV